MRRKSREQLIRVFIGGLIIALVGAVILAAIAVATGTPTVKPASSAVINIVPYTQESPDNKHPTVKGTAFFVDMDSVLKLCTIDHIARIYGATHKIKPIAYNTQIIGDFAPVFVNQDASEPIMCAAVETEFNIENAFTFLQVPIVGQKLDVYTTRGNYAVTTNDLNLPFDNKEQTGINIDGDEDHFIDGDVFVGRVDGEEQPQPGDSGAPLVIEGTRNVTGVYNGGNNKTKLSYFVTLVY